MDEPKRSNVSRFDGSQAAGDTARYGARDDEMLPISHSDRPPPDRFLLNPTAIIALAASIVVVLVAVLAYARVVRR